MNIVKKVPLPTKELIYKYYSDFELFRLIIPDLQIGKKFCSITRKESNPSAIVKMSQNERLYYVDYGDSYSADIFELWSRLYGLSFQDSINAIAARLGLSNDKVVLSTQKPKNELKSSVNSLKRHCFIQVHTKPYDKESLQYWLDFGITLEDLRQYEIYNVKELFVNRKKYYIQDSLPIFAYYYPEGFKIYKPLSKDKKYKWLSSIPLTIVEGDLAEYNYNKIIITKSKKDRIVLKRILENQVGVLSVQNESIVPYTPDLINRLKNKEIWINYDSDGTGVKNCTTICNIFKDFKYINTPKYLLDNNIKDVSDWYKFCKSDDIIREFFLEKIK